MKVQNQYINNIMRTYEKKPCVHCGRLIGKTAIIQHERACYLNPSNLTECAVCKQPIKNYKASKGTCSYKCSNTHFAHIRNKPEEYTQYKTICFHHYEKKCIVCGEDKIVAVHHYDHNHENNDPGNLIPLCPTHHQYVHSKYKDEVLPIIEEWKKNNGV